MQTHDPDTNLRLFIHNALKAKLLTREEEVALCKKMKTGNRAEKKAARDKLVEHHVKLAIKVARKFTYTGVPLQDLIHEGVLGLMQAAKKFEVEKGFRFSTYSRWWVLETIKLYARSQGAVIRVPESRAKKIRLMNQRIKELSVDGYVPTDQEIADAMAEKVDEVQKLAVYALNPVSLNSPVGFEGTAEMGDFIEDQNAVDIDELIAEGQLSEVLADALSELTERERFVIVKRFGLDGQGEKTLADLHEVLDISRERVRQIQAKALEKLASGGSAKVLASFLS